MINILEDRIDNRQTKIKDAYTHPFTSDIPSLTTTITVTFDPYLMNQIKEAFSENQLKWFTIFMIQDMTVKEIVSERTCHGKYGEELGKDCSGEETLLEECNIYRHKTADWNSIVGTRGNRADCIFK